MVLAIVQLSFMRVDALRLIGGASATAQPLISAAVTAYRIQRPDIELSVTYGASSVLQQQLFAGVSDFVFANSAAALSSAQMLQYPDVLQVPLCTIQPAIMYHLPVTGSSGAPLAFTLSVLSRIFSANITFWDDPSIVNLNPDWANVLVHQPIQVVMANRYTLTGMDNLCTVFGRIDPSFKTRFPCTTTMFKPPISSYAMKPILGQFLTDLIAATQIHSWSISYSPVFQAQSAGLSVANLYNGAGNLITPSQLSAALPALEVGTQLTQGTTDLTTAQGPFAFPFAQYIYVQLSTSYVRASCDERSELVEFLVWLYESSVVQQIGSAQASPIIHPRILTDLGIVARLRKGITCVAGVPVAATAAAQTMQYIGFDALTIPMQALLNIYAFATKSTSSLTWTAATRGVALGSIAAGSQVQDVFQGGFVQGTDVASDHLLALPFATASVRLLYTLPKGITSSQVQSLVLDLETVGMIFTGGISSWLHPRISRLNPNLTQALMANPTIKSNLTVVLCCSRARGPTPANDIMSHVLAATKSWNASPVSSTTPLQWNTIFAAGLTTVPFVFVTSSSAVALAMRQTSGSIGFVMFGGDTFDATKHVKIMPWQGGGANEITAGQLDANGFLPNADQLSVAPTLDAAAACAGPSPDSSALNAYTGMMDWRRTNISKDCWPLSMSIQGVLASTYSYDLSTGAHSCDDAKVTLSTFQWMVSSGILSGALSPLGITSIDANGIGWKNFVVQRIGNVTCDGALVLTQTAVVWTPSGALLALLHAWAGIGIGTAVTCLLFTLLLSRRTTMRQAGIFFLAISTCGALMMFLAVIVWAQATMTLSLCDAFNWLGQLGFTCLFLPVCLRLWRLDRRMKSSRTRRKQEVQEGPRQQAT